jgi:hypothetical protein
MSGSAEMAVGRAARAPVESTSPLSKLLLDKDNPRFGFPNRATISQEEILDQIVEKFGVDDVLSSLAVNGYFKVEPLVCRRSPGDFLTVAEGNRRLAACLILSGDQHAVRHKARTEQSREIWDAHKRPQIDPVPVIICEGPAEEQALLSYLGVRHISSAQPWDSYAKAAWVARVVEQQQLSVADVALMIGDQHRTIRRLLEGYYFAKQLIEEGQFRPTDSIRKGRGSVTEYPFSWVYTILGYSAARRFLGLDEDATDDTRPLRREMLSNGGLVIRAMFGDRSKGRSAAIEDSRDLGDLAAALTDPEKVSLLESGRSLAETTRITQPIGQRLRAGLTQVREIQTDLLAGITERPLDGAVAEPLVDLARRNQRTSTTLAEKIRQAAAIPGPH